MDTDRNLLFGVLALQLDLLDRDRFAEGCAAWAVHKDMPLADLLVQRGWLAAQDRDDVERLLQRHLRKHGNDAHASLAAVAGPEVRRALQTVSDADVEQSLGSLAPAAGQAGDLATVDARPAAGRYRVLRPHAEGGIGEVFVALDTELNRPVALKEIQQRRADDSNSRRRFLLEAEITGNLEHPGIVPVYGLGAYADGRPFYAMRFIKGESLKEALAHFHAAPDFRGPAFRQLLRRLLDVCNAVAYAHSRGVLHRDLKPANVMLGPFGETLVVDWGLAKVIGRDRTRDAGAAPTDEPTLQPASASGQEETVAGSALGTPAYMSPEQAAGHLDRLGPASDVYSLGATLYALLTGRSPFEGSDKGEVLRQVQRGAFPPPRQVQAAVPPALDAICRKAMSFKPADRYPTALDFAADMEHCLADEPVAAYPEPWTVRVGRWARRQRTALVGAAVFLVSAVLALSASTAIVVAEQRETEKQRLMAIKNYAMSRQQSLDIIRLIETSEPEIASVPALHDRRKELLTTASEACRQFREQEPDNLDLQKQTAQIYRFTANFFRLTNETQEAERFYQDSIRLRGNLTAQFPEEELLLADTLRDYAGLQIRQGRLREATEKLNRSLEITERLKEEDKNPIYRRRVALALRNLASIAYRQGKEQSAEATRTHKRSVDLLRGLVAGPPQERQAYDPWLLATALNLTAMIEREADQLEAADQTHREAIKLLRGMLDSKPKMVNEADVAHSMAECQVEQCKTWAKMAKPKSLSDAEINLGVAINKLYELARDHRKIPTYPEALAAAYRERAEIRLQGKNYQGAREHFKSAHALLAVLAKTYGELPKLHGELGNTCAGLGNVAVQLNDEDPEPWFAQAATELRRALALSPEDARWQRALDDLAAIPR